MQKFFDDYLKNLNELHDDVRSAIKGLPLTALDWTPYPGFNSISVLAVHIAGAERYWLSDVIAGIDSGRDREAEFQVRNLEPEVITGRLTDSWGFVQGVLAELTLQDLDAKCISPRDGREVAVGWALGHVLKHTALHVGHIQITRQLWGNQSGN
jgi:uncharacterized damage-inducible protein DinB